MLRITEVLARGLVAQAEIALPFELRRRSRLRACLESGEEVGLFLPRGTVLREGDLLRGEDGRVVRVRAAPETVSVATSSDPLLLAKASYHLGNRHVALQIDPGGVRYLHDHVLDEMVRAQGLTVTVATLPFEPEAGAYGGPPHGHSHEPEDPDDGPGHDHPHGTATHGLHEHPRGHRHDP